MSRRSVWLPSGQGKPARLVEGAEHPGKRREKRTRAAIEQTRKNLAERKRRETERRQARAERLARLSA